MEVKNVVLERKIKLSSKAKMVGITAILAWNQTTF